MSSQYQEHLKTNGSAVELSEILGPGWAICRKTPQNMERYQRCISMKEYKEANKLAVARRNAAL